MSYHIAPGTKPKSLAAFASSKPSAISPSIASTAPSSPGAANLTRTNSNSSTMSSSPKTSASPSLTTTNSLKVTTRGAGGYGSFPVVSAAAEALQQHQERVTAFSHRRAVSDPTNPRSSTSQVHGSQLLVSPSFSVRSPHAALSARNFAAAPVAGRPSYIGMLPPEAKGWSKLEIDLFRNSEGAYHPGQMAARRRIQGAAPLPGRTGSELEVRGRVSIVAPSMDTRQHYHESLWACFEAQSWPDKELIVVETYEHEPSSFLQQKAAEDSRLVHVCIQRSADEDFTVGLKRNMTLHLASGEYVVNFDDDDLYAANYVTSMIGEMRARGLQAITLSAWFNYFAGKGVCTYSDPDGWQEWAESKAELDNILYGYGFSYAHKRGISLQYPYPNVGFAEDAPFMMMFRKVLGDHKVGLKRDTEGICMHIMHRANTAQVLGTCEVSAQEIECLAVADLAPFQKHIHEDFSWWSPWKPAVAKPFEQVRMSFTDLLSVV